MGRKRPERNIALDGLPSWMTNIDEVQFDTAVPYGKATVKIPVASPDMIVDEAKIFNEITNNMLLDQARQMDLINRAYPMTQVNTANSAGITFTGNYVHQRAEDFAQELLSENPHVWRGYHPRWKPPGSSDIYLGRFGRFDLWWATAAAHDTAYDEFIVCEDGGVSYSCNVECLAKGEYVTNVHASTFLVAQRRLNSLCWKHKDELVQRLAKGERNIYV